MLLGIWFWLCSTTIVGAALVLLCGACIATLLGFLGALAWPLALLDHLRPHYVLCIGVASFFLLFCRAERSRTKPFLLLGLVALSINMSLLLPLIIPHNRSAPSLNGLSSTSETSLSILHFNLDRENRQRQSVITYLDQQEADILLLQEITPDWLSLIEQELIHYEIVTALPQSNSQGSAVLKRRDEQLSTNLAVTSTQIHAFPSDSTRSILSAEVTLNGQTMTLLSLHVTRPRNASTSEFQKTELEAIAHWVHTIQPPTHPVIILGDFNSTPWSQVFHTFQRQSGLSLAQQGWGLKPTWPTRLPSWLQIPIDCCLHSSSLTTVDYQVGPHLGSDHHPITVRLG